MDVPMKHFSAITLGLLAMISCQKSTSLTVSPESIYLYSNETEKLSAYPSDNVKYTVKDDFYATVSSTGLVQANKVGETEIIVTSNNGRVDIPVTVIPQYSLYPELEPLIGSSVSWVTRALGGGYTEDKDSKGQKTHVYKNYNKYVYGIVVTFNGSTCSNIGVVVSTSYTSQLANYLKERYKLIGTQDNYYFFLDHSEDVTITLTVYSADYLTVIYNPNTISKSGKMDLLELEEVLDILQ